jgi:hypothetical protein
MRPWWWQGMRTFIESIICDAFLPFLPSALRASGKQKLDNI